MVDPNIDFKNIESLDQSLNILLEILPVSILDGFRNNPKHIVYEYHHGLGTRIRNEFGLWGDGMLKIWFYNRGIRHPDDMSGIILESLYCRLHNEDIKLEEQIKHYREFWIAQGINPDTMEKMEDK
jgi:hypothetical protein